MKAIVLIHGALGAAADFDAIISNFSLPVYAPDIPGHGQSDSQAEMTLKNLSSWLTDYVRSLPESEIMVFGYSMGGYIALQAAIEGCSKIAGIVTLGTKFNWTPETAAAECAKLDTDKLKSMAPDFCKNLEALHGNKWEQLLEQTRNFLCELGETCPLNPATLGLVEIPVKLMRGDRDRMVSLAETVEAFESLPLAQLAVLPGTPHPLNRVSVHRLVMEIEEMAKPA